MAKTKPRSIRAIGLRNYLDSTRTLHNDRGYDDFLFYRKYRVPRSAIGRMFNVNNKDTIRKWFTILEEEESVHGPAVPYGDHQQHQG